MKSDDPKKKKWRVGREGEKGNQKKKKGEGEPEKGNVKGRSCFKHFSSQKLQSPWSIPKTPQFVSSWAQL